MPRNMSFAMTIRQIKDRTKNETRRFGWWFLKEGDVVNAVEKSMGFKKGEKIKVLCQIRILSTRAEPLNNITQDGVYREGFLLFSTSDFVEMLVNHYKIEPEKICNVIEFEYVGDSYD